MIRMASVGEALALLREHGRKHPSAPQTMSLADALGRLAQPARAAIAQPAADVSSMDGYAVRFPDMRVGAKLKLIGESRAGAPFDGPVGYREAVRIFTGAHLPEGANHVLIQEDARRDGESVEVAAEQKRAENIRRKGRDFSAGDVLVPAGQLMTPGALALAAAGGLGALELRAPRIVVLANGDELVEPGEPVGVGQAVNSVAPALIRLAARWGARASYLGIAKDNEADVRSRIAAADAELVVSIGGASVGDYDVVRPAFAAAGFAPVFEKVAVRPGKPTWFSASPKQLALGLPGNPAAAMVTARLFLKPLIEAMAGAPAEAPKPPARAHVAKPLPAGIEREDYLRAVLTFGADGRLQVQPAEDQDSSLLHPFLAADTLIRRPPKCAAALEGELVEIVPLG